MSIGTLTRSAKPKKASSPTTPIIQSLGSATLKTVTSTMIITVGATTTVGHSVLIAGKGGLGGTVVTTVTDSRGNTWTVDKTVGTGASANIARCTIATGKRLVNGDTITITWDGGASSVIYFWAEAWETHALTLGTTAGASTTEFASSITSTPSLTPTTNTEWFFAVMGTNSTASTGPVASTPFLILTLANGGEIGTGGHRQVRASTYIAPNKTPRTATFTWTGTVSNAALAVALYKVNYT